MYLPNFFAFSLFSKASSSIYNFSSIRFLLLIYRCFWLLLPKGIIFDDFLGLFFIVFDIGNLFLRV